MFGYCKAENFIRKILFFATVCMLYACVLKKLKYFELFKVNCRDSQYAYTFSMANAS